MSNPSDILADATWLPHVYDPAADRVLFAHISPQDRHQLTFLADHKPAGNGDAVWIDGKALHAAQPQRVPVHFVFHSAFCRSTLFVKALDALPRVGGQSEPAILNTLQTAAGNRLGRDLLAPVLRMLARPLEGEEVIVIKPSNFANGLIPSLLGEQSRAIILYGQLRPFLLSIARKGLSGRLWARKQLAHSQQVMPLDLGMDGKAMFELSDMQAAGLAWLLQMNQFNSLLARYPDQLRSLDTDRFIDRKEDSLCAATDFFGRACSAKEAQTVTRSPVFASHAKLGGDYAKVKDQQDAATVGAAVDEEIGQVAAWCEVIMQQLDLRMPLGAPLLAD